MRGKSRHYLQLGSTSAPETVSVADETLRTVEFSAVDLKQKRLEGIEQLAVFRQAKAARPDRLNLTDSLHRTSLTKRAGRAANQLEYQLKIPRLFGKFRSYILG